MDQELLTQWKAKDPLDILKKKIKNKKKLKMIEEKMDQELDEAVAFAKNSPQPSVDDFLASIPNF
jgi:pyruvate dehydrogenase E1 component alpha subunit